MPPEPSESDKNWKKAITTSAIVHVVILLVAILGLPFLPDRTYDEPMPIGVEVLDVSEVAQTNKPLASAKKAAEKKPDEKPTPQKPPPAKEPPKPAEKPKPVEKPVEKVKEETPPPPESELGELEAPKPVEKPKPEKPKPKQEEPKKEDKKKPDPDTQEQDFSSLLKNLDTQQETAEKPAEQDMMTTAPAAETPSAGEVGDRVTMSELDALRQQLAQCWSLTASSGAAEAENLIIEVRIVANPDRTVQQASVVDQSRYMSDPFFAAAADSAVRAVNNPRCSPLKLPEGKYDQWKTMTIRFDPREML